MSKYTCPLTADNMKVGQIVSNGREEAKIVSINKKRNGTFNWDRGPRYEGNEFGRSISYVDYYIVRDVPISSYIKYKDFVKIKKEKIINV